MSKIFRLSDYLDGVPAIVEEKKRYANFKITPIGGQVEIIKWREEQAQKLAAYQVLREELKQKKVEFLAGGPDAPLGELTWKGKALLADTATWDQKLKQAKAARKRLLEPEILTDRASWTYKDPEPVKKTLRNRLSNWFKTVWDTAFGNL